ncbi:MAG: hypothetical protein ACJ790_17880 [Myxococcaceae bacterium]
MARTALCALLLGAFVCGCKCNDKPAPLNITTTELDSMKKESDATGKCTAFQIIEENGKRRLSCVMKAPSDGGSADAGSP